MKYRCHCWAVLFALGLVAHADGLNRQQISPDAKWLIHVDCDTLRESQLGKYLFQTFLAPKVAEASGQLKLNVSNILEHVTSLTAYGSDLKSVTEPSGVLLINSDAETQKAVEGLLVAQILANTNGPVRKLEDTEPAVYSFANQVFIAPNKAGPIIISKSEAQIEATRELLAGKGSAAATKSFEQYPAVANSFLFVALADVSTLPNGTPARAKVLQMAEGARLALGERHDNVFVDLALRAKSAELTKQVQQVIEGMIALVSLGQPEYPDVVDLAKSTKVTSAGQLVSVSVEYPAAKVLARLNEQVVDKPQKDKDSHHKMRAKDKKKKQTKPEEEAPKPKAEDDDK